MRRVSRPRMAKHGFARHITLPDPQQFVKGVRMESREHKGLPEQDIKVLVWDHLSEDPEYYKKRGCR